MQAQTLGGFPLAFREVRPKYLVITNLSEYQENRTGSPEELYQLLLSCVRKSDAVLCINEDCPVSGRMLKEGLPNRIIPFSARENYVCVNRKKYPANLSIPGDYNVENAGRSHPDHSGKLPPRIYSGKLHLHDGDPEAFRKHRISERLLENITSTLFSVPAFTDPT